MTKLEIFVEMMKKSFSFSDKLEDRNFLDFNKEDGQVTIFSKTETSIYGVDEIGCAASALGLCCSVFYDTMEKRVEIFVH